MEYSIKKNIGEEQMKELSLILSLIDKYKTTTNSDERNALLKMLSVRHVTTKAFLTPQMIGMFDEKDIEYVRSIDLKLREILIPIYNQLLEMAVKECREWFLWMMRRKGQTNPKLHKYQEDLIRWLLRAIIVNELNDVIYTLLVSRGKLKVSPLI